MPSMLIYVVRCMCAECEIEGPSRNTEQTAIWAWNTRDERELTALKLAATEQATQAEAVLEERTRERDEALAQ